MPRNKKIFCLPKEDQFQDGQKLYFNRSDLEQKEMVTFSHYVQLCNNEYAWITKENTPDLVETKYLFEIKPEPDPEMKIKNAKEAFISLEPETIMKKERIDEHTTNPVAADAPNNEK